MKLHTTEWEHIKQLEKPISFLDRKIILTSKAETQVFDEYGQFLNIITEECIKQVEILSKLQQSNSDVFFNYLVIWNNFFHLTFDVNKKLADYVYSNFFYT